MIPDDQVARTEEMCEREPLAARTRMALLRIEKAHHREGWDNTPPTLYRVEQDTRRDYVATYRSGITSTLLDLIPRAGGDTGEALAMLAGGIEAVAQGVRSTVTAALTADLMAGERPGHRFYGYALVHEGWQTPVMADMEGDELAHWQGAVERKEIHREAGRLEVRMVNLVARDGLQWLVTRVRRQPPVRVLAMRPEGDYQVAGLVGNSLGRMTRAVVCNPSPVPPLAGEARRGR